MPVFRRKEVVSGSSVTSESMQYRRTQIWRTCQRGQTLNRHIFKSLCSIGTLSTILLLFSVLVVLSIPQVTSALSHDATQQTTPNPLYHKPQMWDPSHIERQTTNSPQKHNQLLTSNLDLPDKSAETGRLFYYQLSIANAATYQAREAGCHSLPQWLYLNTTTGTFMGVPLHTDKGIVYINVDVQVRVVDHRTLLLRSGTFLLKVGETEQKHLTTKEQLTLKQNLTDSDELSSTVDKECLTGNIATSELPKHCPPGVPVILANLIFLEDFSLLDTLQRSSLFFEVSQHLGSCPELLFVRDLDWSGEEGRTIWTQLTEFTEHFETFTTVISFPAACGIVRDNIHELISRLESILNAEDGRIVIKDKSNNGTTTTCNRWFLTSDLSVLNQSKLGSTSSSQHRLRRQAIEISLNTVPLPVVTSTSLSPARTTVLSTTGQMYQTPIATSSLLSGSVFLSTFASSLVAPQTRVIPSSEASRTLFTASPIPTVFKDTSTAATTRTSLASGIVEIIPPTVTLSSIPLRSTSIMMNITSTPSISILSSIKPMTSSFPATTLSTFFTTSLETSSLPATILSTIFTTSTETSSLPATTLSMVFTPSLKTSSLPATTLSTIFTTSTETSSLPATTLSAFFTTLTETFMFSTSVVQPTPSFSESPLVPMSSSALTASVSIFTPSFTPSSFTPSFSTFSPSESTTFIIFPTETFIPPTSMLSSRGSTSTLVQTSLSTFSPTSFSQTSFGVMSSTSTVSETSLNTLSLTSVSPTRIVMSTAELSPSISIFMSTMVVPPTESDVILSSTPDSHSSSIPVSSSFGIVSSTSAVFTSLLVSTQTPSSSILLSAVTPTPTPISICDFIDCMNGTCFDLDLDFECVCYPGWTGEFCNTDIDFCIPFPCSTNNTVSCVDGNTTYTCNCSEGYTGTNCTEDADPCSPNPCLNGGTCILDLMAGFECVCPRGIAGLLCETDVNPCFPDPCDNGEMCIDFGRGGFSCSPIIFSTTLVEPNTTFVMPSTSIVATTLSTTQSLLTTTVSTSIVLSLGSSLLTRVLPTSLSTLSLPVMRSTPVSLSSTPTAVTSVVTEFTTVVRSTSISSSFGPFSSLASSSSTPDFSTSSLSPTPSSLPPSATTPSVSPQTSISPATMSSSFSSQIPSTSSVFSTTSFSPTPSLPSTPNEPPVLLNPIRTILSNEGMPFHFSVQDNTFFDTEDGFSSNLTLSLLDSNGNIIPNSSWIQLRETNVIEGIPLAAQIVSGAGTDHVFILRAQDRQGASTYDLVTVRVLPQVAVANFLLVTFEGDFVSFDQNLTSKVDLATRLSSTNGELRLDEIYVREFRSGSIVVAYSNLSISDLSCGEFHKWTRTVYRNGQYSAEYLQALVPFRPIATPFIEGLCAMTSVNVVPTIQTPPNIDTETQSELILLLATIVSTVALALLLLLLGLLCLLLYRRKRKENGYLDGTSQKRVFLNRKPLILPQETELPSRGRRPIVLPEEAPRTRHASRRWRIGQPIPPPPPRLEVENVDLAEESSSDEELVDIPFLNTHARQRIQMSDPPAYKLPPDYFSTS